MHSVRSNGSENARACQRHIAAPCQRRDGGRRRGAREDRRPARLARLGELAHPSHFSFLRYGSGVPTVVYRQVSEFVVQEEKVRLPFHKWETTVASSAEHLDRFGGALTLGYQLTPHVTLGARYQYTQKDSDVFLRDYTQNRFSVDGTYSF